jgi:hypothetical protein
MKGWENEGKGKHLYACQPMVLCNACKVSQMGLKTSCGSRMRYISGLPSKASAMSRAERHWSVAWPQNDTFSGLLASYNLQECLMPKASVQNDDEALQTDADSVCNCGLEAGYVAVICTVPSGLVLKCGKSLLSCQYCKSLPYWRSELRGL